MKVLVEVTNKTNYNNFEKLTKSLLVSLAEILKKEKKIKARGVSLSVAIVGEKSIKLLSRQYRKKDEVTDVLSFCYEKSERLIGGEIVICPSYIEKYCKKEKENFKSEFKKNLVHGFLHVIGHEHSRGMFVLQDRLMQEFKK